VNPLKLKFGSITPRAAQVLGDVGTVAVIDAALGIAAPAGSVGMGVSPQAASDAAAARRVRQPTDGVLMERLQAWERATE
jgi:hypothetical protein